MDLERAGRRHEAGGHHRPGALQPEVGRSLAEPQLKSARFP